MTKRSFLYDSTGSSVTDEVLEGWAVELLSREEEQESHAVPMAEPERSEGKELKQESCHHISEVNQEAAGNMNRGLLKVRTHYGYEGWLRMDEAAFKEIEESGLESRQQEPLYVIDLPFADVLSQSRVQGTILRTLSRGSFVTLLGRAEDHYCRIRTAGGIEGYIPEHALTPRLDSDGYLLAGRWLPLNLSVGKPKIKEEELRRRIIDNAMKWLGTGYRWGGHSGQGIDCSGLSLMSYMMSGILIWRDAEIVNGWPIHPIPFEKRKPGDLLYFPGHVAICLGGSRIIHSTGYYRNFGVCINTLDPSDTDVPCRADLAEKCLGAGSIFT